MKGVAHCGKIMIAKLIVFLTIVDHNVSTSVLLVFIWGWCDNRLCVSTSSTMVDDDWCSWAVVDWRISILEIVPRW